MDLCHRSEPELHAVETVESSSSEERIVSHIVQ
jgi:hypothetical protein